MVVVEVVVVVVVVFRSAGRLLKAASSIKASNMQ